MKKGYYRSRSKSYDRYKDRRSDSRSREKQNKRRNYDRDSESFDLNYRHSNSKVESDIKNHFWFKLPNLNGKDEQDTLTMLKSKLNQYFGPVDHITYSRQQMCFNLGFKYDKDAMKFLQTRDLTIKLSTHKIRLEPTPTKVFTKIIKDLENQKVIEKRRSVQKREKRHSRSRSQSKSHSSQSNSRNQSYQSRNHNKQNLIKLQIYGLPAYLSEQKASFLVRQSHGGPYKIYKSGWKQINQSYCQYLQVRLEPEKADRMLESGNKIQIEGRGVLVVESQRPLRQLINYQVQIQFPKAVHPSKVQKYLQFHAKVIQMVAIQQFQQDGKCKGFIITLNDRVVASSLKKLGELSCGIKVSHPKHGLFVYRPILTQPRNQQ